MSGSGALVGSEIVGVEDGRSDVVGSGAAELEDEGPASGSEPYTEQRSTLKDRMVAPPMSMHWFRGASVASISQ